MQKTLSILITLLLFWSCKTETKEHKISEVSIEQKLQSVLDSIYFKNTNAIGILTHVESKAHNLSWNGAAGYSDKNKSSLVSEQPVLIASNTKTFISVAILRLVEMSQLKLNQSIDSLIFKDTNVLLKSNNYNTSDISILHLLNHTSGISDYATTDDYITMVKDNPSHRYSRDEQIRLAMTLGSPLGNPGDVFSYADVNYLLLSEVIEGLTDKPFYTSVRELLKYSELGLTNTWFSTLEDYPKHCLPLAHQYWTSEGLDSYKVDHSFDLYGGGGIASTSKDLALFSQNLFNQNIFDQPNTIDLIYTKAAPKEPMEGDYYLGLSSINVGGFKGYGHGGFWGTAVNYFPELDTSISVFVLERDKRILRSDINKAFIKILK
ncbi:serine hydrolase domain-containing protein [Ichthyenterobacterium sp. W332]|uniref:Serine hydrolase domain-containing protein n=1 Tax=Microcosmobacter mediterraneus TaxID=3075607 RepID=A0ABU2YPQ2_9FLAO|nr:serine hydrolase domain-containing protein [Ichthyenterobacterium sp. W332]MDT0559679.1 serine hydrolase domain-containing protein [Ichthyenterobacterium sp. W332]